MDRSPETFRRCEDLALAFIQALDIKLPVVAMSISFAAGQLPIVTVEHHLVKVPEGGDELATRLSTFNLVPRDPAAQCEPGEG